MCIEVFDSEQRCLIVVELTHLHSVSALPLEHKDDQKYMHQFYELLLGLEH
jgi:hypothetical protein